MVFEAHLVRPINTYTGRGVAKPGVDPSHHCIIYTGRAPPSASESENAAAMLQSIRVIPTSRGAKMDAMSRLNFVKLYTVEQNIPVEEFGTIDPDYLELFKKQFKRLWDQKDNE